MEKITDNFTCQNKLKEVNSGPFVINSPLFLIYCKILSYLPKAPLPPKKPPI